MAKKRKKSVTIIVSPLETFYDYQSHISVGSVVSRSLFEERLWVDNLKTLAPFLKKISFYKGCYKKLFQEILFLPQKRLKSKLTSLQWADAQKNTIEYILLESSKYPLGTLKNKKYIGAIHVPLKVLMRHKVISKSFLFWDESIATEKDLQGVEKLVKGLNKHFQKFDIKVTLNAISGHDDIGLFFDRIDKNPH